MISLYKIEKDKYGLYYVSYGKKHRIKTLLKKKQQYEESIKRYEEQVKKYYKNEPQWYIDDLIKDYKLRHYINFHICGDYIQFGG